MPSSTLVASAEERRAAERRRHVLLRWAPPALYLLALGLAVAFRGLPTSRDALFLWILLGLFAASFTNLRRWLHGVLVEWLPFGAVLFAYDILRGSADSLFAAHYA